MGFWCAQRVEDIQRHRSDAKDAALSSIQKKRIQALRKLGKERELTEARVRFWCSFLVTTQFRPSRLPAPDPVRVFFFFLLGRGRSMSFSCTVGA